MEEILLKDICDLDNGYAFKSDDYVEASDTLNCRMSNIRPDGTFDILYSAKYLPNEFAEKYEDYLLNDGDLIIAMTDMAGDPKILGVPTVVDTKGYKLLLNQRVGKLRFIKPGVNADYLKLALQSKRVREYLKRFAGGGVQLNVSKKDILNAPVRMRTEEEQDYIAGLFRRILEIKKQREQELLCLDNLIKARFVELFGDPDLNPMGWKESLLSEKLDVLGGYAFKSDEFDEESGIPVLRIGNINAGYFRPVNMVYWHEDESLERYVMYPGDLVMSLTGTVGKDDYGNVCILGNDYDKYYLNQRNAKLEIKEGLDKLYLSEILKFEKIKKRLTGISRGVRQANIANRDILNLCIPVPPMDKQKQFADFVKQVDKSKVVAEKNWNIHNICLVA